jgi:intracellular sulfur oxidation DsrE/DsrF family protein
MARSKTAAGAEIKARNRQRNSKFVPSGVATVAELQTKGFATIKVG